MGSYQPSLTEPVMLAFWIRCPNHLRHTVTYELEPLIILLSDFVDLFFHARYVSTRHHSCQEFPGLLVPDGLSEAVQHDFTFGIRVIDTDNMTRKRCLCSNEHRNRVLGRI